MNLLLSHSPGFGSTMVKALTFSRFSHIDFILPEGSLLGALTRGVVEHRLVDLLSKASEAEMMSIPLSDSDEQRLIQWAQSQIGKPYDWTTLFESAFNRNRDWKENSSWFCSELVAAGFSHIGKPLIYDLRLNRVTPGMIDLLPFHRSTLIPL